MKEIAFNWCSALCIFGIDLSQYLKKNALNISGFHCSMQHCALHSMYENFQEYAKRSRGNRISPEKHHSNATKWNRYPNGITKIENDYFIQWRFAVDSIDTEVSIAIVWLVYQYPDGCVGPYHKSTSLNSVGFSFFLLSFTVWKEIKCA